VQQKKANEWGYCVTLSGHG